MLLGLVGLVVGLVQLAPGAEAAQYSAVLIATGSGLLVLGILLIPLRSIKLINIRKYCSDTKFTIDSKLNKNEFFKYRKTAVEKLSIFVDR